MPFKESIVFGRPSEHSNIAKCTNNTVPSFLFSLLFQRCMFSILGSQKAHGAIVKGPPTICNIRIL